MSLPAEPVPKFVTFERDGWICYLCERETLRAIGSTDPMSPTFDHVIPLTEPGSPGHIASNIKTAHRVCNLRKGTRSLAEFMAYCSGRARR